MLRKLSFGTGAVLLFAFWVLAAQKPDFTGDWVMDRGRSFGLPGDMQQTMVVKQTAEQIDIETKLIQPKSERSVKDTYVLDGKEHEFSPLLPPNAPPASGKRVANWLPAGNGIVVNEVTTSETPKGKVTSQLTRKWTLSKDGELVIDMYVDGPNGSFEMKRIFKRK
jgi:hypothetical protein